MDIMKLIRISDYFAENYCNFKNTGINLVDLHSTEAFDCFIKILNGESPFINIKYKNEILSLMKEWKCTPLLQDFDDTIHNGNIEPKKVYLKLLSGEVHLLHISNDVTLDQFQGIVEKLSNVPKKSQHLVLHGQNLITEFLFKSLQNEDRVTMASDAVNVVPIYVKDLTGKSITIHLYAHSTIRELQLVVCQRLNISFNECRLILNGIPLSINKTMDDYGIKKESAIHYILRQF
ncbi:Ubiquitin family protein [Trichomonas vaginalis G3]|uniref:Ubiquitin family protein n=1 Tax=Trichomonas vaginalis (strain ATCC PRA-98 / G3) TaxID=412133 RepID=A2F733_TRIV3|nr:cellular macromolecule catabolic process [Trichomonas vaginalis G3]EAX99270.1 Ubiquitin family protein [Trichomonas vaginalis G3]KAI5524936.1 cellular macromolecule catabolic process [Trichomonas vaginalis G3]|eukprot:XP_001312200.1 Ubiquitin family protein [Trichomonas vaginalis G3]